MTSLTECPRCPPDLGALRGAVGRRQGGCTPSPLLSLIPRFFFFFFNIRLWYFPTCSNIVVILASLLGAEVISVSHNIQYHCQCFYLSITARLFLCEFIDCTLNLALRCGLSPTFKLILQAARCQKRINTIHLLISRCKGIIMVILGK